jgi:hypothetical protein
MSKDIINQILSKYKQEQCLNNNICEYVGKYDIKTYTHDNFNNTVDYIIKSNYYHRFYLYEYNFEYYYSSYLEENPTINSFLLNLKLELESLKNIITFKNTRRHKLLSDIIIKNKFNFFRKNKNVIMKLLHKYEYDFCNYKIENGYNSTLVHFDEPYLIQYKNPTDYKDII